MDERREHDRGAAIARRRGERLRGQPRGAAAVRGHLGHGFLVSPDDDGPRHDEGPDRRPLPVDPDAELAVQEHARHDRPLRPLQAEPDPHPLPQVRRQHPHGGEPQGRPRRPRGHRLQHRLRREEGLLRGQRAARALRGPDARALSAAPTRARAPRSLLRLRRGRLPPVQLLEPARALRLRPDGHRRGGERVDDQLHVHGPRGVGAAGGDFRRHPPRRERHAPGRGRHDHHLRDGRGEGDAVPRLGARLHRPHVRCAGRGDAARGLRVLRGPVHGRRGRAPRRDGHAPPLHGHVRHHGLPRLRVHALRQGLGRAEPHAPRALGLRRRRARVPRGLRDDGARRLRDQLHLLHGALHRPGRRLRRHARRPRVLRPARPRVRDGAFLRKLGRSPPAGRTSRIPSRNACARPCTTRARPSSSRA